MSPIRCFPSSPGWCSPEADRGHSVVSSTAGASFIARETTDMMPLHFLRSSDLRRAYCVAALAVVVSSCSSPPSPFQTELARCDAINFLPQRAACIDNAYGPRPVTPTKGTPSITPTIGATSITAPNPSPPASYVEPKATGAPIPLIPGTSVK